jgi:hypothetical protein
MSKIEEEIIRAVKYRNNFTKGNSSVCCTEWSIKVRLHGNLIFKQDLKTGTAEISSCGWESNTTKSRLNALLGTFCDLGVRQKNYVWELIKWTKDGWIFDQKFEDGLVVEIN